MSVMTEAMMLVRVSLDHEEEQVSATSISAMSIDKKKRKWVSLSSDESGDAR